MAPAPAGADGDNWAGDKQPKLGTANGPPTFGKSAIYAIWRGRPLPAAGWPPYAPEINFPGIYGGAQNRAALWPSGKWPWRPPDGWRTSRNPARAPSLQQRSPPAGAKGPPPILGPIVREMEFRPATRRGFFLRRGERTGEFFLRRACGLPGPNRSISSIAAESGFRYPDWRRAPSANRFGRCRHADISHAGNSCPARFAPRVRPGPSAACVQSC